MDFKEAIEEILIHEGRFTDEFSKKLSSLIMKKTHDMGLEIPTFNLLWSLIHSETLSKKEFAQELAEYIMYLYYYGGYINKSDREIERISQIMGKK